MCLVKSVVEIVVFVAPLSIKTGMGPISLRNMEEKKIGPEETKELRVIFFVVFFC